MEIKSISQRIFKTPSNNSEINSNHTNPFGVNFKGNIINADVFETERADKVSFKGMATKAREKCKNLLKESALVGSMGDVANAIKSRLDSVVQLGRRMKEGTNALIGRIPEVFGSNSIISNLADRKTYGVPRLLQEQPSSIEQLWRELDSSMEALV